MGDDHLLELPSVFVNGCSVDSGTCAVSWQIKDGGDGE